MPDKHTQEKSSIINVEFSEFKNGENFRIQAAGDMFSENYYREPANLFDGSEYDMFVKGCENAIRRSDMYSEYIAYLKNEVGLTRDAFNSDMTDDVVKLEMHHGPIFTLYDYVKIAIEYLFDNAQPVSTFTVGKLVMNEHAMNRVQVVMLTKNNHKLVHANKLFVDLRQCHGRLKDFITIYHKYIESSPKLVGKIRMYKNLIETKKLHETDILQISNILSWNNSEEYKERNI